jgi:probable rRNA maturation factor
VDHDSKRQRRSRTNAPGGLQVTVSDGRGRLVRDGGLARWLSDVCPPRVRGEVAVALVTDAHIHKLNSQYRRKNAPTDVLSFPADGSQIANHHGSRIPDDGSRYLGDIVIATGIARRQGRDAGHSYQAELRVLALHGLLHLLGYDHDSVDDRGRMARVEKQLRRCGGLQAGLIERS